MKNLDAELAANQYLNESKEQARIASLDGKKGILLGTIDRKFSKATKISKVFIDILTDEGVLERLQCWGSIPRENKNMQVLPILKECLFMGAMTDPWTSPSGDEYTNFDVEAIDPVGKKAIAPDDFVVSEEEIIDTTTDVRNLPEGKFMCAIVGKVASVRPYQEKSWDELEGIFVLGAEHPLLMSSNLCLTFGIRVNEDIYVKAHFPEQKLGWPTWSIYNDLEKVNGIKQVLASMPVNATTERKMGSQLQNQVNTITSIFKGFTITVIGEVRISRSEGIDEVRTFIEMFPSFVSIHASADEFMQGTLDTVEEVEDEEPEEKIVTKEMADEAEAETEAETKKAFNELDHSPLMPTTNLSKIIKAISVQKSLKTSEIKKMIEEKKEELGFFVNDIAAAHIIAKDLEVTHGLDKKEPEKTVTPTPPPIGLTEEKLIFEAVNDLGQQGEALAKAKVTELKNQYERLGMEINLENIIKTAAVELNIDITAYEKQQAKLGEERAKLTERKTKKPTPPKKKKKKASPKKKTTTSRKKKAPTGKGKNKWDYHYTYIEEVLGVFEDDEEVNISLLPTDVWDILLKAGLCYEPEEGKMLVSQEAQTLNDATKKELHKLFNKNPTLQLRPPEIEEVEKAVRTKLTELKKVVPSATPEHLKPMLSSDNLDCPIELIEEIWNSL